MWFLLKRSIASYRFYSPLQRLTCAIWLRYAILAILIYLKSPGDVLSWIKNDGNEDGDDDGDDEMIMIWRWRSSSLLWWWWPNAPINNIPSMVQIMVCNRTDNWFNIKFKYIYSIELHNFGTLALVLRQLLKLIYVTFINVGMEILIKAWSRCHKGHHKG